METFRNLFRFDSEKKLLVGVEREFFITNDIGIIVPDAPRVIDKLCEYSGNFWSGTPYMHLPKCYGYELSACQLEVKIGPVEIEHLPDALQQSEEELIRKEERIRFRRRHTEVAPDNLPLDIYPDPTGRYAEITKDMPPEVLLAACQIIGTHIHIGMPDHETALAVYNRVIKQCEQFCVAGDGSQGQRLHIYRTMAPQCDPQPYDDWNSFHKVAVEGGFDTDPRRCWTLIRISVHGTIEFRMFGTTASLAKIAEWARACHDACASILL